MTKIDRDGEVVENARDREVMVGMQNSRAGALYLWYWDDMMFASSIPASSNVMSG